MQAAIKSTGARFSRDTRGNVAVIFAAVLVPVIAVVAAALDYGRASKARDQLAHASEAAAQVASNSLELDRDTLSKLVRTLLNTNLPADLRDVPFEMHIPSDKKSIEISMATTVRTSLLGLVGVSEIPVAGQGFARRSLPGAVEPQIATRAPETPNAVRDMWRALFGGPGPDPELIRQMQEEAQQMMRNRDGSPSSAPHLPAGLPDVGPITSGEDLRRAAQQLGEQLRDLPQVPGAPSPEDIERLMRQLQSAR